MKTYTVEAVEKLMKYYLKLGGEVNTIKDGSLTSYGLAVMTAKGKKFCIVREVYLNEWSSGLSVKFYNKLPKKYNKY